jgi:hypothetical protein
LTKRHGDVDLLNPSAKQYRERAKLIRYTTEAVKGALLRRDLLDIADEFDGLADSVERARFG